MKIESAPFATRESRNQLPLLSRLSSFYCNHNIWWLVLIVAYAALLANLAPISKEMKRSALTEALLAKHRCDEEHRGDNHARWYKVDSEAMSDELSRKFVQLDQDKQTEEFLENCYEKSDAILWQIWHSLAVPVLKLFMTQTNINGYLGRGSMFVFSSHQFDRLLDIEPGVNLGTLLDLGAGDGEVTARISTHFHHVFTTEVSSQMKYRLASKGYTVLDIDNWMNQQYDVITCLNLLDRCDKPMTILRDIRRSLKLNGTLIVASVFPFSPYVEENNSSGFVPSERLHIAGKLEEQIAQFVDSVFKPSGFELVKFSRVPYLCEGDLSNSFYVLHDILYVLKPV